MRQESLNKDSFIQDPGSIEDINNEEYAKGILQHAEKLLISKRNRIGQGQTAEIHFVDVNERHCFKIISRDERYGTVALRESGSPVAKYHPLPVEAKFLRELQGLDNDVRVPKPYYSLVRELSDENERSLIKNELSILCMERLNAVSIRDILENGANLPANFNSQSFFLKVRNFIDKMHSKGIHHRDLHEGNIMIDIDTGNPYIIDFGCAVYGGGDDADTYKDEMPGKVTRYTTDNDNVDQVEQRINRYITLLTQAK